MANELAPQSSNGAAPPRVVEDINNARLATTVSGETDSARAIAEVQGAIIVAQKAPRDTVRALDRIINAFQRLKLAEKAMYAYPRGGETVKGLSIRAAEAIAQNYGNFQFGWRELNREEGTSLVEAFAWDVETNTRATRTFKVSHVRDTRKGQVILKDERDIYELVANFASRRQRAVILALIPFDIQESVVEQADATMHANVKITKETIAALVAGFSEIGVSPDAIQKRLRRRMDAMTPVQYLELRRIWATIKDGVTRPEDYFELEPTIDQEPGPTKTAAIAADLAKKAQAAQVADEAQEPASTEAPAQAVTQTDPEPVESLESRVNFAAKAAKLTEQRLSLILRAHAEKGLTDANFDAVIAAIEKAAPKS